MRVSLIPPPRDSKEGGDAPLLRGAELGTRGVPRETVQICTKDSMRPLYVETENKKISYEVSDKLNIIRQVIGELTNTPINIADYMKWKVLSLTNKLAVHPATIRYYLPHLQKHEDAIYPNVIAGQKRTGVSLVIGISTVRRKMGNYLMSTLNSLFDGMSEYQKKNCVIVVLIAEMDSTCVNSIAESIKRSFPLEVLSGDLEVISPHESFYPDFSNLKETFGDSKDRVRWRTKQNLDYSFLMMYAQQKGTFYLQLEDDIVAKPRYLDIINEFIEQKISQEWIVLEFSQLGFIGKLFRCKDLPLIVEFFLMFYKDKPIDWLLDHLIWVKVCNPEKNEKHCESQKSYLRIRYKPSLFQHVGFHSSLTGKTQQLTDGDFVKTSLFKEHVNPPAKVKTSLKVFQHFTLEKAYNGIEIFWAFAPKAGDYILFSFEEPLKIIRYLFRSGNTEHPGDILFNATVEVLPSRGIDLQSVRNSANNINIIKTWDGYFQIDNFENGVAEGAIGPFLGNIQAFRLSIHSSSPKWILLSEVGIECHESIVIISLPSP
ncbi:alpha-1,3-mannosyl-glycoprotein 4-beta-N-acetylglucosaminyltransferase A [Python bivittatus]|uniref:Alpha-1,3-mannosyl-glycoprotein 4-beta-N-acetylglucosaminyltransferase A n=1 Tax=Python bivittatus TaxID=176946 RepID=A0A9F5IXN2_PYTBI|nr:alpha-1,3-mannosyl-glycoprotein 4-beta-N-acetylglucosaminyltransferase A [Python bivittatus]